MDMDSVGALDLEIYVTGATGSPAVTRRRLNSVSFIAETLSS